MRFTYTLLAICVIAATACDKGANAQSSTETLAAAPSISGAAATVQPSGGGTVYEGTMKGVISDSKCGKDHSGMGEMGKDPAACTKQCVQAGAKYVLVDEKGTVYALSDQRKPEAFAGKPVVVTGHIDPNAKSIHVHSLAAQ